MPPCSSLIREQVPCSASQVHSCSVFSTVGLCFQVKLTRHGEINKTSPAGKVFDGTLNTKKKCFNVMSHAIMKPFSRNPAPLLQLPFLSRLAAPELCKYNKVLSVATIRRLQWKPHHHHHHHLSLSLLFLSVSLPLSLIQLLIWQRSKEINEVLQRKEGFTGRGIVGRGSEMRIWWGVLKTVYLNECLLFWLVGH